MVLREWLGLIGLTGRRLTMNWVAGSAAIAVGGMMAEVSPLPEPLAWVVALLGAGVVAAASPAPLRLWAAAGVLYAAVIAIVPIDLRSSPAHGFVAVLWLFAVVWLTDIGAYFAGRAIGGPKLWPAVSPKKTWAGFIGGVIAGTLTAVLIVQTARYGFGIGWFSDGSLIAVSVVGAIVSQGGDLLESALKRKFHVKDSSHLIPGHGGFMDRLDSFWRYASFSQYSSTRQADRADHDDIRYAAWSHRFDRTLHRGGSEGARDCLQGRGGGGWA